MHCVVELGTGIWMLWSSYYTRLTAAREILFVCIFVFDQPKSVPGGRSGMLLQDNHIFAPVWSLKRFILSESRCNPNPILLGGCLFIRPLDGRIFFAIHG